MIVIKKTLVVCLFMLLIRSCDASVLDWFWGGTVDVPNVKVHFEISTEDEKFLQEAKKYTSMKMSDLDDCQRRVVVNIHKRCSDLTEEELAKMSVNLLNCQSAVEGRQHFPCTTRMSLRECTSSMDPDMWNAYYLMNNRARASIQDFVDLNLRELTREKVLIASGHHELVKMMDDVRNKLDEASLEFSSQVNERHENHKQLREDLQTVMEQVALLWQRIDHSTQEILARHESARAQYNSALYKLSHINATVNFLLDLLDKTRQEFDERLGWLNNLTPDTGNQLDHLYSCVLHFLYLIVEMITAAFIRAPTTTRIFLLLFVPLNLAVAYTHGDLLLCRRRFRVHLAGHRLLLGNRHQFIFRFTDRYHCDVVYRDLFLLCRPCFDGSRSCLGSFSSCGSLFSPGGHFFSPGFRGGVHSG
ncbi:hypothetical protein B7P43_G05263 [Cryptotermes secundus]|uniref:Protein brambleberry n=1 Tax=Cryptotermes secundus TaxID=105785 RepID=A0A2J7PUQ7_9NEOP|nr:hypothetical protein B7P43_G05263 [Cryptotermes secundus]